MLGAMRSASRTVQAPHRLARRWAVSLAALCTVSCGAESQDLGSAAGTAAPTAEAGVEPAAAARMRIERVVADLANQFSAAAVHRQNEDAPIRVEHIKPGMKFRFHSDHRRAIVAPPPAEIRFRVPIPAAAALHFGIGMAPPARGQAPPRAVRFSVRVDGREVFAETLDPVAKPEDRRWRDVRIDLSADAERAVEIVLKTTAVEAPERGASVPGWSHLRIVSESWQQRSPSSPQAPNLLFLLVDTLRADRLGVHGNEPSPSPNLDRLARSGLFFSKAMAQSSWTLPSVASIFTGLPAHSHGVVGGRDAANANDGSYLSRELLTFASEAQARRVTTLGISTNPLVSRDTNLSQGFETFIELGAERGPSASAVEVNDAFLGWLEQHRQWRFLAYLHYMDVHAPYKPPLRYRPPTPPEVRPLVARGNVYLLRRALAGQGGERAAPLTARELTHLRGLYDAQIRHWDDELGRLLAGLAAAGIAETTQIIITSDHGEEFMEHGSLDHGRHLYDETIHVPLVLHGPGIRPGRSNELVQGTDLYPTIAALLGFAPSGSLPGQDLRETLAPRPVVSETRWGFAGDGTKTRLEALREPGWKLIRSPLVGSHELYDLDDDPGEQHDRAASAPAEMSRMTEALSRWRESAAPPPTSAGSDPDFLEKLRALGYAE